LSARFILNIGDVVWLNSKVHGFLNLLNQGVDSWQKQKQFTVAPNAVVKHPNGKGNAHIAGNGIPWWNR
jgi:hypothetical protein